MHQCLTRLSANVKCDEAAKKRAQKKFVDSTNKTLGASITAEDILGNKFGTKIDNNQGKSGLSKDQWRKEWYINKDLWDAFQAWVQQPTHTWTYPNTQGIKVGKLVADDFELLLGSNLDDAIKDLADAKTLEDRAKSDHEKLGKIDVSQLNTDHAAIASMKQKFTDDYAVVDQRVGALTVGLKENKTAFADVERRVGSLSSRLTRVEALSARLAEAEEKIASLEKNIEKFIEEKIRRTLKKL